MHSSASNSRCNSLFIPYYISFFCISQCNRAVKHSTVLGNLGNFLKSVSAENPTQHLQPGVKTLFSNKKRINADLLKFRDSAISQQKCGLLKANSNTLRVRQLLHPIQCVFTVWTAVFVTLLMLDNKKEHVQFGIEAKTNDAQPWIYMTPSTGMVLTCLWACLWLIL